MAASLFEKTQEVMPPAQRVRTTRTESTRRRDDGGQDGEPRRLNEVGEGPVSQLGWRGQQLAKRIQQLAKQRPRHGDQGESRQGRLIHVAGAVELVAGEVEHLAPARGQLEPSADQQPNADEQGKAEPGARCGGHRQRRRADGGRAYCNRCAEG